MLMFVWMTLALTVDFENVFVRLVPLVSETEKRWSSHINICKFKIKIEFKIVKMPYLCSKCYCLLLA